MVAAHSVIPLMEDLHDEEPPWWETTWMKDPPDERPDETTLLKNLPDERPVFHDHFS